MKKNLLGKYFLERKPKRDREKREIEKGARFYRYAERKIKCLANKFFFIYSSNNGK